jgi:hypothetical protein
MSPADLLKSKRSDWAVFFPSQARGGGMSSSDGHGPPVSREATAAEMFEAVIATP